MANAGVGGENHFGENDRWHEIIETNLTGTYFTVQYFLPALQRSTSKYKHIIITSSVLARLGVANYNAYCASKAGLLGLILGCSICTGQYFSQCYLPWLGRYRYGPGRYFKLLQMVLVFPQRHFFIAMKSVPLGKIREPQEIAALASLLRQISMTGQTIDINGGSVMNS